MQVALADEDEFNLSGVVDFVDNQVDPDDRHVALAGRDSRIPQRLLSPGLFVRIRFPVGDPHPALLIPEEALATDQGQRFVYVIGDNNHVVYRRVKVGMLLAGRARDHRRAWRSTIAIAVTGLQRLRKDLEVDPAARMRPVIPLAGHTGPAWPSPQAEAGSHAAARATAGNRRRR